MTAYKITRTVDGDAQFCRGALEQGQVTHLAKTYTTLHYRYAVGSTQEREGRLHFCDAHPPKGAFVGTCEFCGNAGIPCAACGSAAQAG